MCFRRRRKQFFPDVYTRVVLNCAYRQPGFINQSGNDLILIWINSEHQSNLKLNTNRYVYAH